MSEKWGKEAKSKYRKLWKITEKIDSCVDPNKFAETVDMLG